MNDTARKKLKDIKLADYRHEDWESDMKWLIARVEQLEEALKFYAEWKMNDTLGITYNEPELEKGRIAIKALNTGPKVSSSLSEKPE